MTVSATTMKAGPYPGNGAQTVFPFSFKVFTEADIAVIRSVTASGVETTLTLNSDYSVTLNPDQNAAPGGSITYPLIGTLLPAAQKLTILGDLEYLQGTDIPDGGDFAAHTIEDSLDYQHILIKQLLEQVTRSVKVTASSGTDPDALIASLFAASDTAVSAAATATTQANTATAKAAAATASAAAAAASAASTGLPSIIGKALNMLRVNAAETGYEVRTVAQVRADLSAAASGANTDLTSTAWTANVQDFRLSATTGVAVTTADVVGTTNLYLTPKTGKSISHYVGAGEWKVMQSVELAIPLGVLTSGKPYDVFSYNNAGVLTADVVAWTNDTTRATALVLQDGIYVKSGATGRRYHGTFYTTATTTTEDSEAKRYLWNYYHRAERTMTAIEPVTSWTYATATFRQANANTANQLNFVVGVTENPVKARAEISLSGNTVGSTAYQAGIGLDSTTVNSGRSQQASDLQTTTHVTDSVYAGYPAAGKHSLTLIETCITGSAFLYGSGNGNQSGITGTVWG